MAGAAPTAKPAPFLRPLDTLDRGLLLAESALSTVIVMLMVLFAVAEPVIRTLGRFGGIAHSSLFAALEPIARAAPDVLLNGTLWAAFLGASFATRGRKHLAIDALGRLLPDRHRRFVVGVAATFGAVVAFALAKGIYETLLRAAVDVAAQIEDMRRAGTANAAVDRSYQFQFVIPGGFLLISVRLLLHAFHEFAASIRGSAGAGSANVDAAAAPYRVADGEPENNARDMVDPVAGAPVDHASGVEALIALAVLVGLVVIARGTTVAAQLGWAVALAIATLVVPLVQRWRKTKSLAPTIAPDVDRTQGFAVPQFVIAAIAMAAVIGLSRFGIAHIQDIPIKWGIVFFGVMAILGAPLFTFLGGMALFLWAHGAGVPGNWDVAPQSLANSVEDALGQHFARMSVLPTIPVFTLAGYLMSESNTPKRLVRVARAFLGWAPGGLAVVCLLASAFFTIFSGASGITIIAIGGLLYPALIRDKYPEKFSLGLVTTGGALGITFFPCLPFIVYGIVAGIQEVPPGHERLDLQKFIRAGVGPGLLTIVLMAIFAVIVGVALKVPKSKFDAREAGAALWEAKWEILLPVFLLGGLATGTFNPSQAAAFTAFYVLIIEVFIYKDLSITRDLPRIIPESMILVGAIFVKLCAATVLTAYFIQAQTADKLFEALTCGPPAQHYMALHADSIGTCREAVDALARVGQSAGGIIDSKISFLIALNVFLLVVGMLMDIFSAIVVIVPLIAGIALHFNINPYHLGVVFLLNLEIGYLMPPMGLNLFIAGFRFNRPVPDLYPMVAPFIGIFVVALLVTTYVPKLTTMMVPADAEAAVVAGGGGGSSTGTSTTTVTAVGGTTTGAVADAGDCSEPGENESFADFQTRCSFGTPAHDAAVAAPAPTPPDCDVPRDGEPFDVFQRRCSVGGDTAHDAGTAVTDAAP